MGSRSVAGMLTLLRFIVSVLVRRLRSRAVLELENLALRHQLHVLCRQRPGRPRLFVIDRLLWVWLYRLCPRCLEVMVLVKPATVIQWHHQGFRRYWRWRSRSGRPSVTREVRELIRQMSSANPLWGAPRIHGEILKLGIEISQATVAKYMVRCAFPDLAHLPAESRRRRRCDRYVRCGICVVSAALRDDHSGPRSQEDHSHGRHRASHRSLALRQVTEAFPWDTAPRYLLRDHDASYGSYFRNRVEAMGITEVVSAPRSRWQKAFVERVIGSIRRECLDHVVIFNERHLSRVLSSYVDYYQRTRTHLSLDKDCPESRPVQPPRIGRVVAIPQVAGLHHRYEWLAA